MDRRKAIWLGLLFCAICGVGLCLRGWLRFSAEREARTLAAQATQTAIDTLTAQHGAELTQLIADYEYGRWEMPDLTVTVTHHYVLEYTETRCQAYAAVAVDSEHIYNPLNSRPCGFCAVYIFVRAGTQQPWTFGAFLPIMGNYSDHLRDWDAHHEQFEGLIEIRPAWEACPYYSCRRNK
jgi:hypothetical protein